MEVSEFGRLTPQRDLGPGVECACEADFEREYVHSWSRACQVANDFLAAASG